MLKKGWILTLVVIITIAPFAPALAQVTFDLTIPSHYIWRGFLNLESPIIQPAVTYNHAGTGVAVTAWANFGLKDREEDAVFDMENGQFDMSTVDFDELDLILTYTQYYGDISVTGGFFYLAYFSRIGFPDSRTQTEEIFIDASWSINNVTFGTGLYYDVNPDGGDGPYYLFSTSYILNEQKISGIHLPSVVFYGNVGYMDQKWRYESGWSDMTAGITTSFNVSEFTISPDIGITYFLWDVPRQDDETYLWGSLRFSYTL